MTTVKANLDTITGLSGRVACGTLQKLASHLGEAGFVTSFPDPMLVGGGVFRGDLSKKEKSKLASTLNFKRTEDKQLRDASLLGDGIDETIYPLVIKDKLSKARVIFQVGRSNSNDFIIPDYAISGKHAQIRFENSAFFVQDLGSTNGTSVDGRPLTPLKEEQIREGSLVKFGRYQFTFLFPKTLFTKLTGSEEEKEIAPVVSALYKMIDASGRFDFVSIKTYAQQNSQETFCQQLKNPVFVGAALFPGKTLSARSSSQSENKTVTFRRFSDEEGEKRVLKVLERAIYPLLKNPRSPLPEGIFMVGRSEDADVQINDHIVSTRHCQIRVESGRFFMQDSGSTNGTSVNDSPLQPNREMEIQLNDQIGFGRHQFVFLAPQHLYEKLIKIP